MKQKYQIQFAQFSARGYAFFRIAFGVLLMINGLNKWLSLPEATHDFPDPLHLGSAISLYLTIFAELFCGLAITLGLITRLASVPVISTFLVAVFLVHGNDSFDVKQAAILYLIVSVYILCKGSGMYSFDSLIGTVFLQKKKHTH